MFTPSIYELLDDPIYRRYAKTIPRLPRNLQHGQPWQVWALTRGDTWKTGKFATYPEAWAVLAKNVKARTIKDGAIVSRRYIHQPPVGLVWDIRYTWCGRCRRPSHFEHATRRTHHALRSLSVLAVDDTRRCIYCGMRLIHQGYIKARKAEA